MNPASRALPLFLLANLLAVALAVGLGLAQDGHPHHYFAEGRFTTVVSCGQLLAVAALAVGIYRERRRVAAPGARLWLCMAAGLVFLVADDAFEFHERFDDWVHAVFSLRQNWLSDRIDDAVIALYAVGALAVLWTWRRELLPFRAMQRSLLVGFAFVFGSVACDTVSNRIDVFHWLLNGDRVLAKSWQQWGAAADEACKLLAAGAFVATFYGAWRLARQFSAPRGATAAATVLPGRPEAMTDPALR